MSTERIEIHGSEATRISEPSARPSDGFAAGQMAPNQAAQQPAARPQWLPEKFQSPEELARAYSELETKFTKVNQTPPPTDAVPQERFNYFSQEFAQNGTLSDQSYGELETMGIPRDVVDAYIHGQQAVAEAQVSSVYSAVGGPEQYQAMTEWAAENIPEAEIDAFNNAIESGDQSMIMFAIRGLSAQYAASTGSPRLVQGSTSTNGTSAFRSIAEVTSAMRDPRYRRDPAYRQDVENKLRVSNVF
jgi:hypothetical protein